MTVTEVASATRAANRPNQIMNAILNYPRIRKMFETSRPCFSTIQLPPGMPMMIVGGGPSLDLVLARMKEWQGGMICTPQTWPSLKAAGVVPNFVFAMDPSIEDVYPLEGEGNAWTTLVTHPSIHPAMLDAWKGPIVFLRINYDDPEEDTMLNIAYEQMLRVKVGAQGNVANMAMIAASQIWRCSPIVFAGVDLADTDGKTHADYFERLGEFKYKPRPFLMASSNRSTAIPLQNPDAKGVDVNSVNQFYSVLMLALWKNAADVALYSISGGINPFPVVSVDDCMARRFPPPMSRADVITYVDERTIPHGVYGRLENGQPREIEFAEQLPPGHPSKGLWHKDDKGIWHRSAA